MSTLQMRMLSTRLACGPCENKGHSLLGGSDSESYSAKTVDTQMRAGLKLETHSSCT